MKDRMSFLFCGRDEEKTTERRKKIEMSENTIIFTWKEKRKVKKETDTKIIKCKHDGISSNKISLNKLIFI